MADPCPSEVVLAARRAVLARVQDSIAVKQVLLNDQAYLSAVADAGCALSDSLLQGGKVLFFAMEAAPPMHSILPPNSLGDFSWSAGR